VHLVEPLQDVGDHERRGAGGAVLPGDVGLLREAGGHVVHDGHDDAHRLLGRWDTLSQLQLGGERKNKASTHTHTQRRTHTHTQRRTHTAVSIREDATRSRRGDVQRRASWT